VGEGGSADLCALVEHQRTVHDDALHAIALQGRKGRFDRLSRCNLQRLKCNTELFCGARMGRYHPWAYDIPGVDECDAGETRNGFPEHRHPFSREIVGQKR
jgi:hypothetical protein